MDFARLRYMADQIARNFATLGEDEAAAATVNHIELYWDPRMKAGFLAGDGGDVSPVIARVVEQLRASEEGRKASA